MNTRQRVALSAIIAVNAGLGIFDVAGDLAEGATFSHVAVEGMAILLGIVGVVWIWLQNQGLKSERRELHGRLADASAEALAWREKSQSLIQGLSRSIDAQLDAWQLTGAEKQVALLILKGLSLKEVADARGTSERTTRQQSQEIYRKSKTEGRAAFAAFFLEDLMVPDA